MTHLFINALSASAGGGLTYIHNLLHRLPKRDDVRATVVLGSTLHDVFKPTANLEVLQIEAPASSARRFWYEQRKLPKIIRRSGADILLSPGNFILLRSPVPQILLSRNALYTSRAFVRDLRERGEYRMWLVNCAQGALAKWSVKTADCTVTPSAAFSRELEDWTGKHVLAIHHGFDSEVFFDDPSPLSETMQKQLTAAGDAIRLLFVSHYNYYRNFETLFRAIAILKKRLHPRAVRLIVTCKLRSKDSPGNYCADAAAALVHQLGISQEVIELGAIPYRSLHRIYRACDLYVTAAYAETFAHPLVEAMASGVPVVASDLAVHREICGEAARYFPVFSAEELAECVIRAIRSNEEIATMRQMGLLRSRDFSWDKHIGELLKIAHGLVSE